MVCIVGLQFTLRIDAKYLENLSCILNCDRFENLTFLFCKSETTEQDIIYCFHHLTTPYYILTLFLTDTRPQVPAVVKRFEGVEVIPKPPHWGGCGIPTDS